MKKILIIVIPALLLYGCGVWANFTTYFNLYYNASDLFEKAEKEIKDANTDEFSIEPLKIPSGASTDIKKIIEKCSNILQFHANSSYVDDALMMTGKCFYYQTNYQKALRKFNELLATQPNSELVLEANLWIGMTQIGMRDFDKGMNTLQDVMDKAEKLGNKKILEKTYITEIKYKISQQDDDGAISLLEDFLKASDNNTINAQAALRLGQLYEDNGDLTNAIKSFKRVDDYSPSYTVLLNSMLELGKAYRQNNEYQNSLDLFNSMRSESKYLEDFDKIDLQRGITLVDMNKLDEAVEQLIYVDTSYSKTPSSGLADYELAKVFENTYSNFDSAYYYYKKSLSHALPLEYKKEVGNQVELIEKYKNSLANLIKIHKDILYIEKPETFVQDSLEYINKLEEEKKQKHIEELKKKGQGLGRRFSRDTRKTPQDLVKLHPPVRPKITLDSLQNDLIKTKFEIGNLLFTEFNLPDSAIKFYHDILNNFPDSYYQAKVLYAVGSYYLVKNDSVKADSLFNIIYDKYKNESIVNAAANKLNKPFIKINKDQEQPIYALAEEQLDNSKYDSSLFNLHMIYKHHPTSAYAPKALYTYGWILENKLNLPDSAAAVYDTLSKRYPNTKYTYAIKAKLSFYQARKSGKLEPDSANGKILKEPVSPEKQKGNSVESKEALLRHDREILREKDAAAKERQNMQNKAVQNPDTLIRNFRRFKRK